MQASFHWFNCLTRLRSEWQLNFTNKKRKTTINPNCVARCGLSLWIIDYRCWLFVRLSLSINISASAMKIPVDRLAAWINSWDVANSVSPCFGFPAAPLFVEPSPHVQGISRQGMCPSLCHFSCEDPWWQIGLINIFTTVWIWYLPYKRRAVTCIVYAYLSEKIFIWQC